MSMASVLTSQADLTISVNDGKSQLFVGQNNTYTIVVTNTGPSDAPGVIIQDTFPSTLTGVTFAATQVGGASGFTAAGTGNINDIATLPAGSCITYKAKGTISSLGTGTLTNTATVTSPSGVPDPSTGNNSASDTDSIGFQADLKITVNDGITAAVAGQKDTYTIIVTNSGPSNVVGAVVNDSFPITFTGVTFTATEIGGAAGFTAVGSGNIHDTVSLPAGSHITYKAKGIISSSATGALSNSATVTAPTAVPDPDLSNNTATDTDQL
jgi:uncharacterized repeat protein (TIGR01451 family)